MTDIQPPRLPTATMQLLRIQLVNDRTLDDNQQTERAVAKTSRRFGGLDRTLCGGSHQGFKRRLLRRVLQTERSRTAAGKASGRRCVGGKDAMSDTEKNSLVRGGSSLPTRADPVDPLVPTVATGPIPALITGFLADMRTRTLTKVAAANDAQANAFESRSRAMKAYMALERQRARLGGLSNIIEEDQRAEQEERTEAEHQRWRNARRRARERDQADFEDMTANFHQQTELEDARKAMIEARRMTEAADKVSDEEVERLYLEAAANRIQAEYNHLLASHMLSSKGQDLAGPRQPSDRVWSGLIAIVEDEIKKANARELSAELLLNLLARLKAAKTDPA